ncbi:MAG: hypothetical protein F4Y44_03815 [Chloroflexi bacterium]|nr:hypothetical protein [Chloroflexota bacterium]
MTTETERQEEQTYDTVAERTVAIDATQRMLVRLVHENGRRADENYRMLDAKIDGSYKALDAKIDSSYKVLDAKIDSSYKALDAKIDGSYKALDAKIDNNYKALDAKIDRLIRLLIIVAFSLGGIMLAALITLIVSIFIR